MDKKKKYLILGSVKGIGGWSLYVDARYRHCLESGFETFAFDSTGAKSAIIQLKNLMGGKVFEIPELAYPFYVYSKRQIEHVIITIKQEIDYNCDDCVFIESTCMPYIMWGEIIAKELKAVNYGFILSSHIENIPRDVQQFFEFKYKQHLLSGQTEMTLPELFSGYINVDDDKRSLGVSWGPPICEFREDCLSYIETLRCAKKKQMKIIGYFGSLNKPHFKKLCIELGRYFDLHKESDFLFVSVGSSSYNISENFQTEKMGIASNVDSLNIPALYPVPREIIALMDTCIASWGSANAASRVNKRVIRLMDDVNVIPQGIIGVSIRENPFYKQPIGKETLFQIFDNIFYGSNYAEVEFKTDITMASPDENGKKQLIIDNTMKPFLRDAGEYYDMDLIKSRSGLDKIETVLCRCFGAINTARIQNFISHNKTMRMIFKNQRTLDTLHSKQKKM